MWWYAYFIAYCDFLLDRLCGLIAIRKDIGRELFNDIKECVSEVVCENRDI